MNSGLDELAQAYGIELSYVSELGERRVIADAVKCALLASMGVNAQDDQAIAASLAQWPGRVPDEKEHGEWPRCFVPEWLRNGRAWGITCQLYSLRSQRNHGIGDFEDLAQLCRIGAAAGADFVGISPLHALFLSDPQRCSPYSPSTRQFLNPLFIAIDRVVRATDVLEGLAVATLISLRESCRVNYIEVARLKKTALEHAFAEREREEVAFAQFRQEAGHALESFATFEALSEAMTKRGLGSGWHTWPEDYRDSRSSAVAAFARQNARRVEFYAWLQWLAASQLTMVQTVARDAGMRMGLYLDLAVGVAPDGAATWSDPELVVADARIGAPPDFFHAKGQDWGLAPMSPAILLQRDLEPFVRDIAALMRFAGAIRIDHAMGLQRLYWIPAMADAHGGSYVRYPFNLLLQKLAQASHKHGSIVIGEDLGTVPEGFRERMRAAEVQSYRVLLFERHHDREFVAPEHYPREALACLTTHDLPTHKGWWVGHDIELRRQLGVFDEAEAERARHERAEDRQRLLAAFGSAGVCDDVLRGDFDLPEHLPEALATAAHVYVARTSCRLMGVQIEDLTGVLEPVNLPGTHHEYTNWQRVLGTPIEELANCPGFQRITAAIARERPRT